MRNNLLEEIRKVHPEAVIDRSMDDIIEEIKQKTGIKTKEEAMEMIAYLLKRRFNQNGTKF